jgi:hypothetical protein
MATRGQAESSQARRLNLTFTLKRWCSICSSLLKNLGVVALLGREFSAFSPLQFS